MMDNYKPYLVSWNLTKRCNLFCPHCYMDADSRNSEELSNQEARNVIDELFRLNSKLMLVFSGGEPMLREDIFDLVEYASRKGFIPVMGTNGTLLGEDHIRLLKDAGLKGIGVSIDSAIPSYHDSFRGVKGAWELSTRALRIAKEEGLETQLDVTLTDRNWINIDELIEFSVTLGAKAVNFFFLLCTGRAMRTDVSMKNYESAIRQIARVSLRERRIMVRARCAPHVYRVLYEDGFPVPEGTRGCLAGRHYMRIDPVGNVTPCPYMPMSVGNVRKASLSAIWEESPSLKLLREGRYSGRCGACEYKEICGGCRARSLIERDDYMAEDPLCTYEPRGLAVSLDEAFQSDLIWDDEAMKRMKRVPFFMRNMIIRIIEGRARDKGISIVTSGLIDEIKKGSGHAIHQ